MKFTCQLGDYTFHFHTPQAVSSFRPVLPLLVESPERLDGYAPLQQRKGKPVHVFRFRLETSAYVAKWSRSYTLWDGSGIFRLPKARRAWRNSVRFRERGFATPVVVGYAIRRRLGLIRRSLLITEEVADARRLDDFLRGHGAAGSLALRRLLMRSLGSLLARQHRSGVYHSDVRPANILVRSGTSAPEIWFVDTEAIRFLRSVSEPRRLKNFACLNLVFVRGVTITDRLRLFRAYADELKMSRAERKRLLRKTIVACTDSMHRWVVKPAIRPLRIPSGLEYRAQVGTITEAVQRRDSRG